MTWFITGAISAAKSDAPQGLVALVSLYGLLADPADVGRHVGDVLEAAPGTVRDLVRDQIEAVTTRPSTTARIASVLVWPSPSGRRQAG